MEKSARDDSDAHGSGSAHRDPTLVQCRRCMSMADREPNSLEQRMHLKLTACWAFTFAEALSPARYAGIQIPEAFTMQLSSSPESTICNYGGLPRFTPSNYEFCNTQKRADKCKESPVHGLV